MKIQQISFNDHTQTETKISSIKTPVITDSDKFDTANKKNNAKNYILAGLGIFAVIISITKHKQISKFLNGLLNNKRNMPEVPVLNNVEQIPQTFPSVEEIRDISKIINDLLGNGDTVPKYLYHMTSKENYESIIRTGHINKSSIENGVFLTDIKSLALKYPIKDLTGMIKWYGGLYPGAAQIGSASNTVVLLKIPTESLQKDLTMVRGIRLQSNSEINKKISQNWLKAHEIKIEDYKSMEKFPMEFLYGDEIPVSNFQIVNEVNINDLNNNRYIEQFLSLMFQNKEEIVILPFRFNYANPTNSPLYL